MSKLNDQSSIKEIYSYISENQYVYFATTLDLQPKIRTMVLFFYKGRFFFVTFTNDSKVAQIKSNKLCEVLLPIQDEIGNKGHIKMTGKAKICSDPDARQDAEYYCYFFDQYYDGADDPDFCLIELDFEFYEIMKPGDSHTKKFHS
ncbi:MAG: pyridoxamine 5'-phosphate oxidase family protein [Candidatus Cloacimonetes bacterium]|nr:pyridoxamine 5'-phosphate oxidase family protein [Candidatus Cloacimonadota bacterium]